eukprot:365078-Chlamydomonas_euryale.AAC.3
MTLVPAVRTVSGHLQNDTGASRLASSAGKASRLECSAEKGQQHRGKEGGACPGLERGGCRRRALGRNGECVGSMPWVGACPGWEHALGGSEEGVGLGSERALGGRGEEDAVPHTRHGRRGTTDAARQTRYDSRHTAGARAAATRQGQEQPPQGGRGVQDLANGAGNAKVYAAVQGRKGCMQCTCCGSRASEEGCCHFEGWVRWFVEQGRERRDEKVPPGFICEGKIEDATCRQRLTGPAAQIGSKLASSCVIIAALASSCAIIAELARNRMVFAIQQRTLFQEQGGSWAWSRDECRQGAWARATT